ncbi:DNA polymerase/3'-5' exonuclease PolX [Candidatus Sumerlaeota bacterium]|nr:DNA polymerase/3'-5' exonuclease PolX [Candidatus Sumerlaeota bacterium]
MDKQELASILDEIAVFLELKGENVFKCNAYRNASRTIANLEQDLNDFHTPADLSQIKGIGSSLAEKIYSFIQTGHFPLYEELKAGIPTGIVEMLRIQGLGPKKARTLHEKLGIASIGELEYACRENRLLEIPGFGEKTQENILKGIEYLKKSQGRFHLHEAKAAAGNLYEDLSRLSFVKHIEIAGSLRRYKETIKDIDLLITTTKPEKVMEAFVSHPLVEDTIARGKTKSSVRLSSGINADLRVVSDEEFPFALMYFTGSKEHNILMRGRALKQGYKLNEYGLFRRDSNKSKALESEAEIFAELGLSYIPPELREDQGEIDAAEKKAIPKLVQFKDLRGLFHLHTPYSDGLPSIQDYVDYARKRDWEYIGISDHSQSAYYANGLSLEKIERQIREIDSINGKIGGFRIFKGIESDILPDGSLDYPDNILALFDFVIISIHSKFKMTRDEMTGRIIRAMQSPYATMLGHPTGRLLLGREGYQLDMEAIIKSAAANHVAIELNSHPYRLDLDWRYIRRAIEAGVLISVNPDAHRLENMEYAELGTGIARKGWCEPRHILNAQSARQAQEFLRRKHAQ